jgi:hypothetical protein
MRQILQMERGPQSGYFSAWTKKLEQAHARLGASEDISDAIVRLAKAEAIASGRLSPQAYERRGLSKRNHKRQCGGATRRPHRHAPGVNRAPSGR